MNPVATASPRCPECGAPLGPTAPRRLCSRCVVTNILGEDSIDLGKPFQLRSLEELNASFKDFEIRRLLGRGGMGAVYEARQKTLGRPVALKILPRELLRSQDFLERFQREARSMARMEHPNIARVYDHGITLDGEAYIVMELIQGEPVTTFAAAAGFSVRQRLELFVQVCVGVQHAHQKGIIHRDLKPSNILVTKIDGQPTVKVIDFGLARPLDYLEGDEAVWLSAETRAGTPAYMSPEQAAGGEVDSRTDVFSLGVLLCELLTGETPFGNQPPGEVNKSPVENAHSVKTSRSPSEILAHGGNGDGLGGKQTARPGEVRGDLDAIVLKAIAPDPDRRYQSVAALPEELQRHLRHEPVTAIPPTPGYLGGKFYRRHRVGLLAAVSFTWLLVVAVALLAWGSIKTRRAEKLAAERLRQGEQLIDFILGDLQGKLQTVGRLDILESAITQVEAFYEQAARASPTPEGLFHRAHASLRLGQIRGAQGNPSAARRHLEEAVRLFESAVKARPNDPAWQEELGQAWNTVAVQHHGQGRLKEAETAYLNALKHAERLVLGESHRAVWLDFKASVLHNLAALRQAEGRLEEAKQNYQTALKYWQEIHAQAPDNGTLLEHLSQIHMSLAQLQAGMGEHAAAKAGNAEAFRLREYLLELEPNNTRAQSLLADVEQNISESLSGEGKFAEARQWLDRYRPIREKLAARDPANKEWQFRRAEAWHNQAILDARQGNLEAAVADHRRSWEALALVPPGDNTNQWRAGIDGGLAAGEVFASLAGRAREAGENVAAEQAGRMLVELRARTLLARPEQAEARIDLARACLDLTQTKLALGRETQAAWCAELAIHNLKSGLPPGGKARLDPEHWRTLRRWEALLAEAKPAPQSAEVATLSASDLREARAEMVTAALESGMFEWPASLKEELKRLMGMQVPR